MTRALLRPPAVLLLIVACCSGADLYRISGVVVNAQTGAIFPRARLAVLRAKSTVVVARQITGPDGRFSFDLPQGTYSLLSANPDDPQRYGRKTADAMIGSSIITGPGQDNSNLIFHWFPQGAITGRIVDESFEPVENALVQLVRSSVSAGRRITATIAWTRTDDRGDYRFGRLPAATYYLAVTGRPWYAARSASTGPNTSSVAYATVYYPNSPELSRAAPLVLQPGEEARADFVMRTVPGVTLTITFDSTQTISGTVGLITDGLGGSDGFQWQDRIIGGGRPQRMQGIPPGRYRVSVYGTSGKTAVSGQASVDVNGLDVDVKVPVKPNPTVSGTVQLKNADAKPQGSILASLVSEQTGRALSTAVGSDGSFSFPSVVVGKYRIAVRGTDGYFASHIQVNGATYDRGVVDLMEGETVTVRMVASNETGRVRGFVMNGDQTVEGALVVLAPAAETTERLAYRGFQSDSDGSYDFQNVPTGDYLLLAVEATGLEYTNPRIIRPYLQSAKPVRVESHGSTFERISLVKPAPAN